MINSELISIPQYYLYSSPILNLALESISKLARSFLWAKDGDHSGLHLISWNKATLNKTERTLKSVSLSLPKEACMTENAFWLLNHKPIFLGGYSQP